MSGGHFDYNQYRIQEVAFDLRNLIDKIESGFIDEWGINFAENYGKPEILEKFKLTLDYLEKTHKMVHEVDYLVSGDTGQDSFLKIWKEEKLP